MIRDNKLQGVIAWFVNNPVAANLLFFGVIIVGLLSLNGLRKEAFPSLEPDTISISVVFDSGEPIQAEQGIAIKIENALQTVAGIKRITSTSNAQGTHVSVEMQSGYDIDALYQDIQSQVDAINNLPQRSEPAVITKARRQDHVLWLQLYGDVERQTLEQWIVRLKDTLLEKSAIKDLEIKGKAQWEISVEVDEAKLQAYEISLNDIEDAINRESSYAIGTSLYSQNKTVRLKVSEQAYDTKQFESIVVKSFANGGTITLKDIASVKYTQAEDAFILSRYNGYNAAAIQIVMDEYGDVVDIVEQANNIVKQWQSASNMPDGMMITSWLDKSTLITERLSLLLKNAFTGIALVFIVLALFLNLRVALWVAMGLPFVFCGTLFFMTDSFTGLSLNEMTTFGFIMALGIVVDDAVVIGESIYHTRQQNGDSVANTILGTHKVAAATMFGVLTTVVAFVALSNVQGRLGQVYAQFGTIVAIALLLSLIESKLILPSHLAHLDTFKPTKLNFWQSIRAQADKWLNDFNERIYIPVLRYAIEHYLKLLSVFLMVMVLVMSLPFTGAVRVAFFPDVPGDTVSAEITMYNDASAGQIYDNLIRLEQLAQQADSQLRQQYSANQNIADKSYISSLQVLAESDTQGTVTLELNKSSVYSANDLAQLWSVLAGSLEGVKKTKILAKRGMIDNFKVQLKSNNEQQLESAGMALLAKVQAAKGTSGIDHNLDLGEPQYYFELNEQGRALGLDTKTLSMQVLNNFGGDIVQRFQRGENEIKVRVRYPKNKRKTLADIKAAYVRTPSGVTVPLSSIANVHSQYQRAQITRVQGKRSVFISAVIDKDAISPHELIAQLKDTTLDKFAKLYPDVRVEFAGEAQQQQETSDSMVQMFALAMLAIYALLAIPLKSYIQPLIIMTAIPFGVVGAVLGHWLNGLTLSILSLNGILALSGVVVNDSLLLVSRYNQLIKTGKYTCKQAVIESGRSRLRAVILTSVTTFAGLLPLLSETSLQAQFLIPAAAALGYGILFASFITLLLTPALLLIQQDSKQVIMNCINWVRLNYFCDKKNVTVTTVSPQEYRDGV
ncbi:efflux RND transporter permease subunit [Pseudoalteromonas sp. JBTF-M23]|uniref:Efflux RND transporter permease subunit n=1 Tax=Pseudoalteromonas caenipelagi TaxID=2726988 RepID=A0A849V922_9GAMM|nr:efflux RND transporter permease subunit [Pseudoalteromonas caenipelagi]NOU49270.1 efflux RND transporter permease subunit [Pseudoalteromonas caenipelagi]